MRRKTIVLVLALGAALALVGVASAGNGGFAPVTPESPNADRIHQSYLWIAAFALAIFVVVEGALVWFVVRYRRGRRARTVEGPQIHGATRLELIWTAIPIAILAAIAGFIFYKLPGIQDVPAATAEGGPLEIKVNAHQFYWQFTYPNGAISIDEMHAPVGRTVRVVIRSGDVVHSWWIPALGGKFDAIPGRTTDTWFRAERRGIYRGQCGEFCGVLHAQMAAHVEVESPRAYQAWVSTTAPRELGRSQWEGVCAKCHGLTGRGGYGPAIFNNSILIQPQSLRTLLEEGQNTSGGVAVYMPPVGRGWTDEQFRALERYMRRNIYKSQASGG
ncbi:MAG TPA: cytochrome c oxidase subunit II [Gaiellaceae bacterium]